MYEAPEGHVIIEAPESPLDGSNWNDRSQAQKAIQSEQIRIRKSIESQLQDGGPLMHGLTLFALQLQELGWDMMDLDIDLAGRIVIFPGDEMLSIKQTHLFLEELIEEGVQEESYRYGEHLDNFQARLFDKANCE